MSTLIAIDEEKFEEKFNAMHEKINQLVRILSSFNGKDEDEIIDYETPSSLSIIQSAIYLSVSQQFIRDRIKDGTLQANRVGTRIIRIKRTELDKLKSDI